MQIFSRTGLAGEEILRPQPSILKPDGNLMSTAYIFQYTKKLLAPRL
jgi:hypothetical protein